jgi:hypothetical protein
MNETVQRMVLTIVGFWKQPMTGTYRTFVPGNKQASVEMVRVLRAIQGGNVETTGGEDCLTSRVDCGRRGEPKARY